MQFRALLVGVSLSLPLPAIAQGSDAFLVGWQQRVGQQVQLPECFLNSATSGMMYCDAQTSGIRLYIDTKTFDPTGMQQALADCAGYDMEPQCKVALSGTLMASFGSPLLVDGLPTFLAGDANAQSRNASGGGELKPGEYACIGSGGSIMAGMGFIVRSNGSYTDLDKTTSGRYTVAGEEVFFQGGHLDGQTGRDLSPKGAFVIGRMASCEPW